MDRSSRDGFPPGYINPRDGLPVGLLNPPPSARRSADSTRLRRKKSKSRVQSENLTSLRHDVHTRATDDGVPPTPAMPAGQRRSSIRRAMRKLFGRSSRDAPAPSPPKLERLPPHHHHARSEPLRMHPPIEQPDEDVQERQPSPPRSLLAPPPRDITPSPNRLRSPYALEFKNSARLKPYELGTPFDDPGSMLRRRKTLPTILLDSDDENGKRAPPMPTRPMHSRDDTAALEFRSTARDSRRRSRSANDLLSRPGRPASRRKRSEEIRFWRESYRPSTLLCASSSAIPLAGAGTVDILSPPAAVTDRLSTPPRSVTPPAHVRDFSQTSQPSNSQSPPTAGTSLSQDLEDRIAMLEGNLSTFQHSLQRLQADKNRRTVVVSASNDAPLPLPEDRSARTASTLVEDLRTVSPFGRPRDADHYWQHLDAPLPTHSTLGRKSADADFEPLPKASPPSPPQLTLLTLFNMLTTERTARENLEVSLLALQLEVQDLRTRISHAAAPLPANPAHLQQQPQSSQPRSSLDSRLQPSNPQSPLLIPSLQNFHHDASSGMPSRFSGSTTAGRESMDEEHQEEEDDERPPYHIQHFMQSHPLQQGHPLQSHPVQQHPLQPAHHSRKAQGGNGDDDLDSSDDLQTPYEAYTTPTEGSGNAIARGFDFGIATREGGMF